METKKKKKPKTKEVKFIEERKRSVTFTMDQINRAFQVDKRLDWSEREGRRQLKLKVFSFHRVLSSQKFGLGFFKINNKYGFTNIKSEIFFIEIMLKI